MSTEEEEERTEYVEREEPLTTTTQPVVTQPVVTPQGTVVRETVVQNPATPFAPTVVAAAAPPEAERRQSVVRRTNTNFGAIVATIVGAVILLLGIFLVFTRVFPYLTYPWSLLVVLLVAVVLIAVGGSMMQQRTTRI